MAIDPQALTIQIFGWEAELQLLRRIKAACEVSGMSVQGIIEVVDTMIVSKEALVMVSRRHLPDHSDQER